MNFKDSRDAHGEVQKCECGMTSEETISYHNGPQHQCLGCGTTSMGPFLWLCYPEGCQDVLVVSLLHRHLPLSKGRRKGQVQ